MLYEKGDKFKNAFLTVSNKCAPFETRRLKNRNNPWIDNNIVRLIYKRDYLKRTSVKYKSDELWESYKQIRNTVTELIRSNKKKYYENCIEENHCHTKGLWKVLKKLIDGESIVAPPNKLTAVHFNKYFSSIGSTTISHLLTTDDNNTENAIFWRGTNCTTRFNFNDIHLEAVRKQPFALGNTSNNDVLGFDSKLLCLGADIIAPILTTFYNASLTNKIVISDWKVSKVTPIYKGKGNKEEAGNYRPISLIGHIMKIFEKEIKTQLMLYLEINDLITIDQSAYRQQHNTQTALHRVIDDWLCNMSDGNLTAVCSFDITKCFDTINHSILLRKMEYYGLQSENIKWFKSYLNEREQMVSCHNTVSGKSTISIGVPQGSVLGPLLFLMYVNDINRHVHLGACSLYADDTLVYCNGSTMSELKHNIQQCVSDIHEWYDQNKLVINKSKSSVMLATTRQRILHIDNNDFDVHIGDYKLVQSDCIDYLGLKIDETISWNMQIDNICKNLVFIISRFSRLKHILPLICLCSSTAVSFNLNLTMQ